MSSERQPIGFATRSTAIILWSLLAFLTRIAENDFSFEASFLQMALVSIGSSTALFLFHRSRETVRNLGSKFAFAIAVLIPLGWTVALGGTTATPSTLLLLSMGLLPVVVVQCSMPRTSSLTISTTIHTSVPCATGPASAFNSTIPVIREKTLAEPVSPSRNWDQYESMEDAPDVGDSPDVVQWMTRTLTNESEVIEGGVRIEFVQGQRDLTVHLSFCPPLRDVPEIVTEDLDAAELEIRVAASFPFGARVTIRRPVNRSLQGNGLGPGTYRIGFAAIVPSVRRAA